MFSFFLDNSGKLSDNSPGSIGSAVDAATIDQFSSLTVEEQEAQRAEWNEVRFFIMLSKQTFLPLMTFNYLLIFFVLFCLFNIMFVILYYVTCDGMMFLKPSFINLGFNFVLYIYYMSQS